MAEAKVILKNAGRVPFQATMYHNKVCANRGVCTCKVSYPEGPKAPAKREEASFRINVGETSAPLPAAVKHIPQVKTALRRRPPVLIEIRQKVEVEEIR